MLCEPALRLALFTCALPPSSDTDPRSRPEVASWKLTVPVGVTFVPRPVTTAVKVTLAPKLAGLADEVTAVLVEACVMLCEADELDPEKFASPLKVTAMLCEPTLRLDVLTCALPLASSVADPRSRPEVVSRKLTVPVGVTFVPTPVTTAVKLTLVPKVAELADAVTAVLVEACVTLCTSAAELDPWKFASPTYRAMMLWDPTLRAEVFSCAVPFASTWTDPRSVVPSLKSTNPVGGSPPALTTAVKVTVVPKVVELEEEVRVTVVDA
jgi:hypothetical protein